MKKNNAPTALEEICQRVAAEEQVDPEAAAICCGGGKNLYCVLCPFQ